MRNVLNNTLGAGIRQHKSGARVVPKHPATFPSAQRSPSNAHRPGPIREKADTLLCVKTQVRSCRSSLDAWTKQTIGATTIQRRRGGESPSSHISMNALHPHTARRSPRNLPQSTLVNLNVKPALIPCVPLIPFCAHSADKHQMG